MADLYPIAKSNLRAALQCKDPHLFDLLGNRFAYSRSTEPGINESVFQIAGGKGPVSPLHMNSYAAYSLNYHHSGASRIITVAAPKHFAKLEEFMYIAQNGGTVLGRPWCSQFVKHQPMYVPHATLSLNGVEYTEVVQHQGEMVIIFPYAYHQAYASGPNITEEVLYASDRSKVFHREQLYHHCNRKCAGGQSDDFDLKMVFSNTLETAHRTRAGRDFDLTSISPRQSQDASTSQSNDADSPLPKRLRGLKALDLISDGGGEWLPSDHDFGLESSTGRKSSRLTSNPHEPDMWDPDSAFEPTYGQASNDEDTPTGGNTPRRGRRRGAGRKRGSSSGGTPRKRRTR